MNKLIFLRHAETKKDPLVNAVFWGLSEKGKEQSVGIASILDKQNITHIYVSEEPKTFWTVEPLAKKLNIEVEVIASFNEVKRGDKYLTKQEFEEEKIKQLEDLDYKAFDGEFGFNALNRFKKGISDVLVGKKDVTILIVTHGTILNIYFADLLNKYEDLPARWSRTLFCSYGIMEDNKVIKDIV